MVTLFHKLEELEDFTAFCALARKTPLAKILSGQGAYTVFAPTNDAFDNLPEGTVNRLLTDLAKLTTILSYHIVPGAFTTADSARLSSAVTTLEGSDLRIATAGATLTVNGVRVMKPDIVADNGVAHGINQVLAPLVDLGEVVIEHEDVVVFAPQTMVVITPRATASPAKASAAAEESDENGDIDM